MNQKQQISLIRREARKVGLVFKRTEARLLGNLAYAFFDKGKRVTVYMTISGAVKGLDYLGYCDPDSQDFWSEQK